MSKEHKLKIPDYALLRNPDIPCSDPNSPCNACCVIASDPSSRLNLGLDTPNGPNSPLLNCACHDICAEEVTLIASQEVHAAIPYPLIGRGRLGPGITLPAIPGNTQVLMYVTCADEQLGPNCDSVTCTIGLIFVIGTVVLPAILRLSYTDYFDFPGGFPVSGIDLQTRIQQIDGSCQIIQLRAQTNGAGTAILVDGKVIDKLWSQQNLWVAGLEPYGLSAAQSTAGFSSIVAKNEFINCNHQIGPCNTIP